MYTLYIIECADKSLYTGITTDLARRFAQHQAGKGGHYTRAHKPVRIVYSEEHANRSQASVREAAVKKLSREAKLTLARSTRRVKIPLYYLDEGNYCHCGRTLSGGWQPPLPHRHI